MYDDDAQFSVEEQAPAPASPINVQTLLYLLLDRWWIVVICTLIAAGVTYRIIQRSPEVFAATSSLKLETEQPKILKIEGVAEDDLRTEDRRREKFRELQQLMKNRALMLRVVETANLAANPHFAVGDPTKKHLPAAKIAEIIPGLVRVEMRGGSTLVDITAEHGDPDVTALIANTVAKEMVKEELESYKKSSKDATEFLNQEAVRLQTKLAESEGKLQTYRDKSLTVEQRQTVTAENLKDLNRRLHEAEAERIRLQWDYGPAHGLETNITELLNVPWVASDATVMGLRATLAAQRVEFANMQQVYRPKHPTYIEAESRLQAMERAVSNASVQVLQRMKVSYDNAIAREQSLTEELAKQENSAKSLDVQLQPYNTLLRDIEQDRALYDSVIKRMGEMSLAGRLEPSHVVLFQEADPPKFSIRPAKRRMMIIGVSLGSAVGLLIAIGLGFLDDTVRTLSDAERFLKIPVLASIPKLRSVRSGKRAIVMDQKRPAVGAQAFRALRTAIFLNDPGGNHRSFLFTSTLPGEGKTFCALNFAVSLARQGLRTLLIDCDLHRPSLAGLVAGDKNAGPGLTDTLGGQAAIIRETAIENLFFLSSGTHVSNSAELLAQRGLKEFMEQALTQFDRVVIDSAPLLGLSDTLLVVPDVQTVCLVVRAGKASRLTVQRAIQTLQRSHAHVSGLVLNAVSRVRMRAYGEGYYGYGSRVAAAAAAPAEAVPEPALTTDASANGTETTPPPPAAPAT